MQNVFRVQLEVGNLAEAVAFHRELLQLEARPAGPGLAYFDCGSTILSLREVAAPKPMPQNLYFATNLLGATHARAAALASLSKQVVPGGAAGDIAPRPWGETSFFAVDPWANPLCFVDEATLFVGGR